ncbi:LOW QUALITY PROTEIN: fatty acyl-CoA reductase wat-like isoform X7 [Vespula squamosa]|uniref:Fatty acyl-CoA reductase wat-like isoform X7 n=1 Tax=Vespula squamosa TaxID=30214 RepID=A0ABD1ZU49_VESSQ
MNITKIHTYNFLPYSINGRQAASKRFFKQLTHILKLDVFDVVVIFTAGLIGRARSACIEGTEKGANRFLEVETMDVPSKESEQEVAFENVDNLTLIRKFIGKLLIDKLLRTKTGPGMNHSYFWIRSKKKEERFNTMS